MSEIQGLQQGTVLHNRYKICNVLGSGEDIHAVWRILDRKETKDNCSVVLIRF